jgi:hypothetical protein
MTNGAKTARERDKLYDDLAELLTKQHNRY